MAERYELVLSMDRCDVDELRRRAHVVAIAKPQANAAPVVVWIAYPPQLCTVVGWDEAGYGLYVARAESGPSDALTIIDEIFPAAPSARYAFDGTRLRVRLAPGDVPRGRYAIANQTASAITSGLVQAATVNGVTIRSRLSAVNVAAGEGAQFGPGSNVYVWTQHGASHGTMLAPTASPPAQHALEMRPGRVRLVFDSSAGAFVGGGRQPPNR
jgi:hypothetical protein